MKMRFGISFVFIILAGFFGWAVPAARAAGMNVFSISGVVYDLYSNPLSGVLLTDEAGNTAVSDARGVFQFSALPAGVHRISAARDGYVFSPSERIVDGSAAASGVTFTGIVQTAGAVNLTGRVLDGQGAPLVGAVIFLGQDAVSFSDQNGNYLVKDLAPGIYTLQVVKEGSSFTPPLRTISLPRDSAGQDFVSLK